MDVSIIIINFNSADYSIKCIDSILRYSQSFSLEIILIDNASFLFPEETLRNKFSDLKIILNKQNIGFSKAVNQGISQSHGDYVLILNNDTELRENSILFCLDFLKKNKEYGVVSPKLIFPDGNIQHAVNAFPSLLNELLLLFRLTKILPGYFISKRLSGEFFNHLESREADWIWGTCIMMPRNLPQMLKDNKLNDDFFMYYEDVYWCYQIRKLGYKIFYLPGTAVIHHLSKSQGNNENNKNKMIMANQYVFLKKEKGRLYSILYFILRGMTLLSQKQDHLRNLGWLYLKYIFK